jgi:hypothetical protein
MDEISEVETAAALQLAIRAARMARYERSTDEKGRTVVKAPDGRTYTLRKMGTLESMDLLEALGTDRAGNSRAGNNALYMHAMAVFSVLMMDGKELPTPNTYPLLRDRAAQIPAEDFEALLYLLTRGDDAGLTIRQTADTAKNS